MERVEGDFLGNTFCEECGGSDCFSVYKKPNGRHDGYCRSLCDRYFYPVGSKTGPQITEEQIESVGDENLFGLNSFSPSKEVSMQSLVNDIRDNYVTKGFRDRGIPTKVCNLFGVKSEMNETGQKIKAYYYPNRRDGDITGYKTRERFKEGDKEVEKGKRKVGEFKKFGAVGDNKKGLELFGQFLHKTAPKRVIITGGQEDAMCFHTQIAKKKNVAVDDIVPGYAVVSPQNGEDASDIKANRRWFDTAEEIYLCFDNDEKGDICTEKVAKIFPPQKVKIIELPEKDACDCYAAGKPEELWFAIWRSSPYCPAGVIGMDEAFQAYRERGGHTIIPFPAAFQMNDMCLGGYALGEIINIVGPTSAGKSSYTNEAIDTAVEKTDYRIGIISLEADKVEFAEQMYSLNLNYRLVEIPEAEKDWEAIANAHLKYKDRIFVIEDGGTIRTEEQFWNRIDFLVHGLGCNIIVVDPATTVVKTARLDECEYLADSISYVKQNRVAWFNICHTRKSQAGAKAGSKGAEINEEDILGTGDWARNAMITMIIARDKLSSHDELKNTSKVTVPKIRRNGKATGLAGYVLYDGITGRLKVGRSWEEIAAEEGFDDETEEDFEDKPLNRFTN